LSAAGLLLLGWTAAAPAEGPATATAPAAPLAETVRQRAAAALDALEREGDFDKAAAELGELLADVAAEAPADDPAPFIEAAFALRLARQLGDGKPDSARRRELLKYLRANDRLARALAFCVRQDEERARGVYDLLERLRGTFGEQLGQYAYLAAAVCVVHDVPLTRALNENEVTAPDAEEIFRYFVENERHMLFGVKDVPPELLMYVVDSTASVKEMQWALGRYKGDAKVGRQFFAIGYDMAHVSKGTEKRVTRAGYNLPNILRCGGVCIDQAYFAAGVGKAIGVPTAIATGRDADVGHAWVGFFQAHKGAGVWNFDYGRYADYRVVRGNVLDPQTRRSIPDDHLSIQAELIGAKAADRYAATAFVDAARHLRQAKAGDLARQLDLVEAGLKRAHGCAAGWLLVGELAAAEDMTLAQKKYWADNLQKMCGKEYPDFSMSVLKPMIQTVQDTAEQNALWNACFQFFAARSDLAAETRMAQAEMWEKAGEPVKAGKCYEDVLTRFINSGPFAIEALKRTEQKLRELERESRVPGMYAAAWAKCRKPGGMTPDLMRGTNWVQIGLMYATVLEQAGQAAQAARVRAEVEKLAGPSKF